MTFITRARRLRMGVTIMVGVWASAVAGAARAQPAAAAPTVVTTAALASRIDDADLVLLQVSSEAEYAAGHIRGARHVVPMMLSTPRGKGRLTLEMPAADELGATLSALGISDTSDVVVYYGTDWVSQAMRVVFTLDYAGLGGRTQLLDGGLAGWKAAGHPVTDAPASPVTGTPTLTLRPRPSAIIPFDEVKALSSAATGGSPRRATLVDARAPDFYTGANDRGGEIPRPGHIPGAVNLPFMSFFTQASEGAPWMIKPRAELEAMFAKAGIAAGTPVVTYCHIGQQASVPFVIARMLGYDVRLYDGAFEEWSADTTVPVAR